MTVRSLRLVWTETPEGIAIDYPDFTRETVDPARLLANELTDRQILHNLQLSATMAGIVDPAADNLRTLVNLTRGGIKTPAGPRFISRIIPEPDGWSLTWGITTDDPSNGFRLTRDQWENRFTDLDDLLANAAGMLTHSNRRTIADALPLLNTTVFRSF